MSARTSKSHVCSPSHQARAAIVFRLTILAVPFAVCALGSAGPSDPADVEQRDEIRLAHQWAEDVFAKPIQAKRQAAPPPATDAMVVLRKSHKVLQNRTAWDAPLKLGDRQYEHGLYMDAPAVVRVRLGRPAVRFTAIVGIDNNQSTQGKPDAGSARFHVVVGGERVFSTPVLKLKSGPVAVDVPLNGSTEFVLEVDDGGNGRGWDQCTWAEAAVTLDDGSTRRLGELVRSDLGPWQENPSNAPFSFTYGGKPSHELLPGWEYSAETEPIDGGSRRVIWYKCPKTGLVLECHVTTYADAAGVDWVFYLSNTGTADTPIIEQLMPLDASRLVEAAGADGSATLRWSNGDGCTAESFLPHDELLERGRARQFQGTSSDTSCFPFFNLKAPGGGWILAVGWSGRWMAEFLHHPAGQLAVRAGMQNTYFRLKPGERVRTPRILLMRYLGDEMIDGHNRFRRLMLDHYVQRRDGKPAEPPVAHNSTAGLYVRAKRDQKPLATLNEQGELAVIPKIAKWGCEAYWLDAYWYPQPWSRNLGNWYPRPDDFPRGLRPLSDAAHRHGMKFVLWFAPFHVRPDTQWAREHFEHVHGGEPGQGGVLKLGEPATQKFVTDWLCGKIEEWGIDIYREDLGIGYRQRRGSEPPEEASDRIGVAEMRHVEGFYRVWSDLLERNPGLLIDNCCGGGRRIDLETNRRAFTLWRSDFNDIGQGLKGPEHWPMMGRADQVMVTGLSLYLPFHTGPVWDLRPYCFRSAMASGIVIYNDLDGEGFSDELARQAIAELKELRPLFQGDLYPLLPLTTSQADWYAYQLDRPDLGQGCALFFRRPEATEPSCQVELHNIDPAATYQVTLTGETYDEGGPEQLSGRELERRTIKIPAVPGSALLRYTKVGESGSL